MADIFGPKKQQNPRAVEVNPLESALETLNRGIDVVTDASAQARSEVMQVLAEQTAAVTGNYNTAIQANARRAELDRIPVLPDIFGLFDKDWNKDYQRFLVQQAALQTEAANAKAEFAIKASNLKVSAAKDALASEAQKLQNRVTVGQEQRAQDAAAREEQKFAWLQRAQDIERATPEQLKQMAKEGKITEQEAANQQMRIETNQLSLAALRTQQAMTDYNFRKQKTADWLASAPPETLKNMLEAAQGNGGTVVIPNTQIMVTSRQLQQSMQAYVSAQDKAFRESVESAQFKANATITERINAEAQFGAAKGTIEQIKRANGGVIDGEAAALEQSLARVGQILEAGGVVTKELSDGIKTLAERTRVMAENVIKDQPAAVKPGLRMYMETGSMDEGSAIAYKVGTGSAPVTQGIEWNPLYGKFDENVSQLFMDQLSQFARISGPGGTTGSGGARGAKNVKDINALLAQLTAVGGSPSPDKAGIYQRLLTDVSFKQQADTVRNKAGRYAAQVTLEKLAQEQPAIFGSFLAAYNPERATDNVESLINSMIKAGRMTVVNNPGTTPPDIAGMFLRRMGRQDVLAEINMLYGAKTANQAANQTLVFGRQSVGQYVASQLLPTFGAKKDEFWQNAAASEAQKAAATYAASPQGRIESSPRYTINKRILENAGVPVPPLRVD